MSAFRTLLFFQVLGRAEPARRQRLGRPALETLALRVAPSEFVIKGQLIRTDRRCAGSSDRLRRCDDSGSILGPRFSHVLPWPRRCNERVPRLPVQCRYGGGIGEDHVRLLDGDRDAPCVPRHASRKASSTGTGCRTCAAARLDLNRNHSRFFGNVHREHRSRRSPRRRTGSSGSTVSWRKRSSAQ